MLTEIKEEQLRGVLGTVVPARNEKIGTYLCGRVRQTPVHHVGFDMGPNCRVYACIPVRGRG